MGDGSGLTNLNAALFSLNSGSNFTNGNTAVGPGAMRDNQNGYFNTAIGDRALEESTVDLNTAVGSHASGYNVTGQYNTTLGIAAARDATNINGVVALGYHAMISQTNSGTLADGTFSKNTAVGYYAMAGDESMINTGIRNTAFGSNSLQYLSTGNENIALGSDSGANIKTESYNTLVGASTNILSDSNISNATAIGYGATVSSSNTMAFGGTTVNKWAFGLATTDAGKVIQVGSDSSTGNGAYLSDGGTWTNASSILLKTNFIELEDSWILDKIQSLDIFKWDYKNTSETHIGPTSEQFIEAFDVGLQSDKTHLSTIDVSGVALKGVQVLIDKIESQENQINSLKSEIELLKELIAEIKSN